MSGFAPLGSDSLGGSGSAPSVSQLTEAVLFDASLSATQSNTVREALVLSAVNFGVSHFRAALSDTVAFSDALHCAYNVLVDEDIVFTAGVLPSARALARTIDTLVLTGAVSSVLRANVVVSTAITLGATLSPAWLVSLQESVTVAEEVAATMLAVAHAVESVQLDAGASGTLRLLVDLSESISLDEDAVSGGRFLTHLNEGLTVRALLALRGEQYQVWVMSPDSEAIYQYEGYNFNSFTKFGSRYFGANDEGIHLLEGDTDNGEPIEARVRTGLMDFGTGRLKQMSRAYLGYTAAGALLLKVVTIASEGTNRGKKVEDWYELSRTRTDMDTGRIPVGEGLKSVYWQFVLHNKAGADFATDEIKLHPLISDRRIK